MGATVVSRRNVEIHRSVMIGARDHAQGNYDAAVRLGDELARMFWRGVVSGYVEAVKLLDVLLDHDDERVSVDGP